jgi:AbrB family looped-hinge helix DNA binding protein
MSLEVDMLSAVRVQEKGQVTIPGDIRKKLRLKKGDLVTFLVEGDGVVIKPVNVVVQELLTNLEKSLGQRGIALDDLLIACQSAGGVKAAQDLGLSEDEIVRLYMALQLRAQQALETIRVQAEKSGLNDVSDEEVDREIQAARNEASRPDRP